MEEENVISESAEDFEFDNLIKKEESDDETFWLYIIYYILKLN